MLKALRESNEQRLRALCDDDDDPNTAPSSSSSSRDAASKFKSYIYIYLTNLSNTHNVSSKGTTSNSNSSAGLLSKVRRALSKKVFTFILSNFFKITFVFFSLFQETQRERFSIWLTIRNHVRNIYNNIMQFIIYSYYLAIRCVVVWAISKRPDLNLTNYCQSSTIL